MKKLHKIKKHKIVKKEENKLNKQTNKQKN